MKLTKELFVIPDKEDFFLYAPLKGVLLKVNSGIIDLLKKVKEKQIDPESEKTLQPLIESGIISDSEEIKPSKRKNDLKPTGVTLMPTTDCNLRCIYCYGEGGVNPSDLDEETALATIDFIINNAIKKQEKKISVSLHGGGEPLLWKNRKLLINTVDYVKRKCSENDLEFRISAATNGVLNKEQLEFIKENICNLTLSFDGPEDIQNKQRPGVNGTKTFNKVMKTLEYFEQNKINYGIRSTITRDSVHRMEELVTFFNSISSNKRVHFEPLFECGRCKTTKSKSPDSKTFLENMIKALETARKQSMGIKYSGSSVERVSDSFCGAAGSNFCVTQDGNITSCYEVIREDDSRSEIFFYGSFNRKTKEFEFDKIALENLASRTIDNLPYCSDCFVKYSCAGDCLAKVETEGDMFDPSKNLRCDINREILKYKFDHIDKGGKNEKTKI